MLHNYNLLALTRHSQENSDEKHEKLIVEYSGILILALFRYINQAIINV